LAETTGESYTMKWRAKKYRNDKGIYFVSIRKLSPTEWDWQYNEYDSEGGTFSVWGKMVTFCKGGSYYISIPNVLKINENDSEAINFHGKTMHDTVMRVVNWKKQHEKVTL
jgi:RPA family protein